MKRSLRKSVGQCRYGQKGFTLIELLVVIAILGVLAGVVVPRVGNFMGKGKDEAGVTELHNVQTAVTAVMTDQEPPLSSVTVITAANAIQNMGAYPDVAHRLHGGAVNYIQKSTTEYYYSIDADGTVHGWWDTPGTLEIGVVSAP